MYIELPEDYRDSCNQVSRLQKAMYGLMLAGLLWSKAFSAELTARGFEQCQADPCVFRQVPRGNAVVIIVVYVDDLLMASETKHDEEQAMKDQRSCYPMKDFKEARFYLGCHITRDRDATTLKLEQHRYARTVASNFNIEKTNTTPAAAGAKPLSKDDAPQTEVEPEEMRVTPYREAIGALMGVATMTRPDVAYAAHQLGNLTTTRDQFTGGRQERRYNICGTRKTLGSPTEKRRGRAQNCRHVRTPILPLVQTLGVRLQAKR